MDAQTSHDVNAERWHNAFEKAAYFSMFAELYDKAACRHRKMESTGRKRPLLKSIPDPDADVQLRTLSAMHRANQQMSTGDVRSFHL